MENVIIPEIRAGFSPVMGSSAINLSIEELQPDYIPAATVLPVNSAWNSFVKRTFDIIFSLTIILAVLWWLLPALAVLIKLNSRGPVFFIQKRNTRYGRIFSCIKLRTMYENTQADTLAAQDNDTRITATGRWLRKYHLDELPQLFNVLIGEMSLIGPRPYMLHENRFYGMRLSGFEFRHAVRPGISGLAQSYGQFGNTKDIDTMRTRLALDHHYILHWSLGLDISIALRTLKSIMFPN